MQALARVLEGGLVWDQYVHRPGTSRRRSDVGSPGPGLDGDVVVWSGDPLDGHSQAELVLIDGVPVLPWDHAAGVGRVVERAERLR